MRKTSLRTIRIWLLTAGAAALVVAGLVYSAPARATVAWSTMATTNAGSSQLEGVSCTSTTFCVAVGNGTTTSALAEEWNGSSWSTMTTTNPGSSPQLQGVSCTSSSFCVAVGFDAGTARTVAEDWNGTSWSTMTTTNPGSSPQLQGVSCTSPTFCVAVGFDNIDAATAIAEEWNGSTWSTMSPAYPFNQRNLFYGVSCVSSGFCVASGWGNNIFAFASTLAEEWNGSSWTTMSTTDPSPSPKLYGVSCSSTVFCVSVGFNSATFGNDQTLAEEWNGSTWSTMTTPNVVPVYQDLYNVSCTSNNFCVTVGGYSPTGDRFLLVTLAEEWNGSSWSTMTTTNPGSNYDVLNDVSCTLSGFCVGAGFYQNSPGSNLTLAESEFAGAPLVSTTQAMDGALKVPQGSTLSAGYDFTMPGAHGAATVSFAGTQVTFQATCASGTPGTETIIVDLPDQSYPDPAGSSSWYPSGDQNSPSTYQGETTVPSFCDPGALVSLQQGGQFSTRVGSTDSADRVNVRWHYADGTGGGWSGTYGVTPG